MKDTNKNAVQFLDKPWRILPDPDNKGKQERWFSAIPGNAQPASVPGIIQQVFPDYHGVAWYWLSFKPARAPEPDERTLLRFGAVDYVAEVWLNGKPVGGHEGGETPFTLDATGALLPGRENLLAVRVLNPTDKPIDGIRLVETPHSAIVKCGGIVLPVELEFVPAARVADIFVRPDWQSGVIGVSIVVRNDTPQPVSGRLTLSVQPDKTGETLATVEEASDFAPGETTHEMRLTVRQHRLWELSDPFLYRIRTTLTVASSGRVHEKSTRCGFRDFRVKDGFFFLNGRRVYLKSCHTGPSFPVTRTASNPDLMRRDMVYAKACGFNCVRFLSKLGLPEQLDLGDELGLMIYQEPYASWWQIRDPDGKGGCCQPNEPQMTEPDKVVARYENSFREGVLRDRNHPCIVIWGFLNEQNDGLLFRTAVKMLKMVRQLDPTRLILLSSGRWDKDSSVGSVSNPGSSEWEHAWGAEGDPTFRQERFHESIGMPYIGQGDFHPYPKVPISANT